MAEQEEPPFADAEEAPPPAPVASEEPADDDMLRDSDEELEDEELEEEEAAEDPDKPLSREQCFTAKDLETSPMTVGRRTSSQTTIASCKRGTRLDSP